MKLKQKTGKFILMLIIITTAIWGVVIYKVIDYFYSFDKEDTVNVTANEQVNPVPLSKEDRNTYDTLEFIELNRDPFTFGSRQKIITGFKQKVSPPPKPPVIKPKINYAINGVIINEEHKLVIFEDLTNNKTLFLKEGEVYNEITIKEIGKKKVSLVESDRIKEISLQ